MKKLSILLLSASLLLGGCATLQSAFNSGPVNFLCQPTDAQKADAAKMLLAIDAAQAVGTMFFPVIGIAKASAVLTTIVGGGCFLIDELKQALAVADAANGAVAAKQTKMLKGAPAALPEYKSLRVLTK
jgi:hypothetical protein